MDIVVQIILDIHVDFGVLSDEVCIDVLQQMVIYGLPHVMILEHGCVLIAILMEVIGYRAEFSVVMLCDSLLMLSDILYTIKIKE